MEGWAHDPERPLDPLLVAVLDDEDREIAAGLAHFYRKDLAEVNYAYGWCAFRLAVRGDVESLKGARLRLLAQETQTLLHVAETLSFAIQPDHSVDSVEALAAADPTLLASLDQLDAFEPLFEDYIRARGVEAFLRAVYVYVLSRPIDSSGLLHYGRLVRQSRMSPFAMVRTLADSAEFASRPRHLLAPTQPGFPFRLGAL